MDNEAKEIQRNLVFLHGVFVAAFIFFMVIFAAIFMRIATDISAFSKCQSVSDDKFIACYESKR